MGWDEYESRTWAGWHDHMVLYLVAGAFPLTLQQTWGGICPNHEAAGLPVGAVDAAPEAVRDV